MPCQRCKSERVARISGKVNDLCWISLGEKESNGYPSHDFGIVGGDYIIGAAGCDCIKFEYCLNCGQIQGKFPLPLTTLETDKEDEEDEE